MDPLSTSHVYLTDKPLTLMSGEVLRFSGQPILFLSTYRLEHKLFTRLWCNSIEMSSLE